MAAVLRPPASGLNVSNALALRESLERLIGNKPLPVEARPQILEESWNPEYHAVIREFERRTGIGAVLNTSFNLHGEPVVCSAGDAVDTFERSGLPHLAIGHWLISKK